MPADARAVPPLPVLSVLLPRFGSGSVADTVDELPNAPAALIVAFTVIVTSATYALSLHDALPISQPPPLTLVIVKLLGVSVTCTFVAVDGPAFATTSVYVRVWLTGEGV